MDSPCCSCELTRVRRYKRGVAAYTGLNRTDPEAVWSFQGFAFVGWSTAEKAGWLKGFIDAVPKDHFNVIDMGYSGNGEWHKWDDGSFFGVSVSLLLTVTPAHTHPCAPAPRSPPRPHLPSPTLPPARSQTRLK